MTVQTGTEGQAPAGQSTGEGQAPPGEQGSGGTGQAPAATEGNGDFDLTSIQDPALRGFLEKMSTETAEARREAALYRTERNTARETLTAQQRANETAEQTAERVGAERDQRLTRLETENRDLKVGTKVLAAASDAKAINPGTVYNLVKDRIETDDQGQPTNLPTLIADLKRSDPYLFTRTRTTADAGEQATGPATSMNDRIRGSLSGRRGGSTAQEG